MLMGAMETIEAKSEEQQNFYIELNSDKKESKDFQGFEANRNELISKLEETNGPSDTQANVGPMLGELRENTVKINISEETSNVFQENSKNNLSTSNERSAQVQLELNVQKQLQHTSDSSLASLDKIIRESSCQGNIMSEKISNQCQENLMHTVIFCDTEDTFIQVINNCETVQELQTNLDQFQYQQTLNSSQIYNINSSQITNEFQTSNEVDKDDGTSRKSELQPNLNNYVDMYEQQNLQTTNANPDKIQNESQENDVLIIDYNGNSFATFEQNSTPMQEFKPKLGDTHCNLEDLPHNMVEPQFRLQSRNSQDQKLLQVSSNATIADATEITTKTLEKQQFNFQEELDSNLPKKIPQSAVSIKLPEVVTNVGTSEKLDDNCKETFQNSNEISKNKHVAKENNKIQQDSRGFSDKKENIFIQYFNCLNRSEKKGKYNANTKSKTDSNKLPKSVGPNVECEKPNFQLKTSNLVPENSNKVLSETSTEKNFKFTKGQQIESVFKFGNLESTSHVSKTNKNKENEEVHNKKTLTSCNFSPIGKKEKVYTFFASTPQQFKKQAKNVQKQGIKGNLYNNQPVPNKKVSETVTSNHQKPAASTSNSITTSNAKAAKPLKNENQETNNKQCSNNKAKSNKGDRNLYNCKKYDYSQKKQFSYNPIGYNHAYQNSYTSFSDDSEFVPIVQLDDNLTPYLCGNAKRKRELDTENPKANAKIAKVDPKVAEFEAKIVETDKADNKWTNDMDKEELADIVHPRWDKHRYNSPEEIFQMVRNQWQSQNLPNPQQDLTKRYQASSWTVNKHINAFFIPGDNNYSDNYGFLLEEKIRSIELEIRELDREIDKLYYKKRNFNRFYLNNRLDDAFNRRKFCKKEIDRLVETKREIEYIFSFYNEKRGITEHLRNEILNQEMVINKMIKFYGGQN